MTKHTEATDAVIVERLGAALLRLPKPEDAETAEPRKLKQHLREVERLIRTLNDSARRIGDDHLRAEALGALAAHAAHAVQALQKGM